MPAHLRPLPRCSEGSCNRPATEILMNAVNARSGEFCERHAPGALKRFQQAHETRQ